MRMSTAVKNDPNSAGVPGRIACTSATPDNASATFSTSPEAIVIGAVAPASRNGVITTGCPADAHSDNASTIRKSQTSGLLGLTIPISAGVCSIASRPPQAIAARATASRAFGPEVP